MQTLDRHAHRCANSVLVVAAALALGALALSAQDAVADEFQRLEGIWVVSVGERAGKPIDGIRGGTLTISGRSFDLLTASGNSFKGELRIDPAASPKQLDFVHENGAIWQAIYTVDADAFKLNYVEAGGREPRPRLFATSADTPGSIIVMRRKKEE